MNYPCSFPAGLPFSAAVRLCLRRFFSQRQENSRPWLALFYELLADRHRIGKACADSRTGRPSPYCRSFFGASIFRDHGGALLRPCQRGCQASEIRLEGMLFASLAEIHKLAIQRKDNSRNFCSVLTKTHARAKGCLLFCIA